MGNLKELNLEELKEIQGGWEWWDDFVQGIKDGWNGGPEPHGIDLLPPLQILLKQTKKNMENLQELTLNEVVTIDGGYSWYEFGQDIGSAARAASDFCEGFADGFARGANEAYQNSPFNN